MKNLVLVNKPAQDQKSGTTPSYNHLWWLKPSFDISFLGEFDLKKKLIHLKGHRTEMRIIYSISYEPYGIQFLNRIWISNLSAIDFEIILLCLQLLREKWMSRTDRSAKSHKWFCSFPKGDFSNGWWKAVLIKNSAGKQNFLSFGSNGLFVILYDFLYNKRNLQQNLMNSFSFPKCGPFNG